MTHNGIFGPAGVDLAQLQPDALRFGVVISLPFRIRVADLVHVPPVDAVSDVWLFNGIAIPLDSHLPAILHTLPGREHDGYAALWTQAIVILNAPMLADGALEALRNGDPGQLALGGNLFRALTSLNEIVFGYSEAVSTLFGGTSLRFLTDTEFFQGLRLQFALVANALRVLTEADVREVLEWRPERPLARPADEEADLPADALASIPRHIETLRAHAYHELAFRAKMAMFDANQSSPLSSPVQHLRGHTPISCVSAWLSHSQCMARALTVSSRASCASRGYTLLQLTSQTFMETPLRPRVEDVRRCLDALTIRNDIVHAKQKKGTYRLRAHTFKDLSDAYQAVFTIFSAYINALKEGSRLAEAHSHGTG